MLATLLGTITTYLVNAFIRVSGSIEDVGFFQAANSITNQYVGLVFAAMGMDYFPRLAAISNKDDEVRSLVNAQTEIVMLIVSPIILLVMIAAPLLIRILLTEEFYILTPIIRIMAIGIFFKALSFPMGYISFAKGDKKLFFGLKAYLEMLSCSCLMLYFINFLG